MAEGRRLVIFDVDGTLVDSAALICAAMEAAFADAGRDGPGEAATRAVIGLSLPVAIAALAPAADARVVEAVAAAYRVRFAELRAARGETLAAPLFPGAREAVQRVRRAGAATGVATGKARRGLTPLLAGHGVAELFDVLQTADDAPSKPHPGMALNAMRAVGAARGAVVGDTAYDMAMARAAGVRAVGVAWGCHAPDALIAAGAETVIESFEALDAALEALGLGA